MSVPIQNSTAEEDSSTFWCCLYAVEREQRLTFVYGYAVSAQQPATQWAPSSVYKCAAWRLKKLNCLITTAALGAFTRQLLNGRLQLSTENGPVELDTAGLCRRPSVYALPRNSISSGTPQSFSEIPAVLDSYWCLSKQALLRKVFPANAFSAEQLREETRTLLGHLEDQTSIAFLAGEAGRIGNFEIIEYLSGDFRTSDGLCCMVSRPDTSLVVWVEPPLAAKANLFVNCRMFSGPTCKDRTCILDELHSCQARVILHFSPKEPYNEFEVSVWSDGKPVAYQHQVLLGSIGINMTVPGPDERLITKWSQRFPQGLRARAETVRIDMTERMTTGPAHENPWQGSEGEARALVASWFPPATSGRFFENVQRSPLEAVEFLAAAIRQSEVIRLTIVDPFFDRIGVESLLPRLRGVKEVKVLTSHVLATSFPQNGTVDLAAACEACRPFLPSKLEVINIQSPGGSTQQFHDRYIVIDRKADGHTPLKQVWMLSNSMSSLAVRYPLVIVPLAQEVANLVAAYVESLSRGQVPGRSSVQASVVWTNHSPPTPQAPASASRPNRQFPGWKLILELLVPDTVSDAERARLAVAGGLLAANTPELDWHVPSTAMPSVITTVKTALSGNVPNRKDLLSAISHWAYHGGPEAVEYAFSPAEIPLIETALLEHLRSQPQTNQFSVILPALKDALPLPESLEPACRLLDQAPMDRRNGATPELCFFAEALWTSAPQALIRILDTTRSLALLCWISTEGHIPGEGPARALLASQLGVAQALGVLFLQYNANPHAAEAGNSLTEVASHLETTTLPRIELLLAMIFISARHTQSDAPESNPFAACAPFWPTQPLAAEERSRILALLDYAAPTRAIPMASALADEWPIPTDAAAFRQWCVDQVKAHFPLKNTASPQSDIIFTANDIKLKKAAEAAWRLHKTATPTWFRDEILNKTNLRPALEPLLRARAYAEWGRALDRVTLALIFGIALAEAAPEKENLEELQKTAAPRIAEMLVLLGPEIWHHFGDHYNRLVNVVVFLGCSSALLNDLELVDIESIATNEGIPNVWKLLLLLQSPELIRKYAPQALSMAGSPTVPPCHCRFPAIEGWARVLSSFARDMANTRGDLRDALTDMAQKVEQWRNNLLQ